MTGFLNSPIANSCHPDANPGAKPDTGISIRQSTRTVTKTTINSITSKCAVQPNVDLMEVAAFFGPITKRGLIFKTCRRRGDSRAVQSVVMTLDDAEAFANGVMAMVRQERAVLKEESTPVSVQVPGEDWL